MLGFDANVEKRIRVDATHLFLRAGIYVQDKSADIAAKPSFLNRFTSAGTGILPDRFICKLIDRFNAENEEIRKKGSEEK